MERIKIYDEYPKCLKISDTYKPAVIILKFEQFGFTKHKYVQNMQMDLGLHCLLRPICPNS